MVLHLRECRIDGRRVTDHQLKRDIAIWVVVPHFGGVILGGVFEQSHRRQRLIVDGDHVGGVARLRERFGDDEGDAVTHEARLVRLQKLLVNAVTLRCAEILWHHAGREPAELIMLSVSAGQYQQHSWGRLRLRCINIFDARMRCGESTFTPWHIPGKLISST